MIKYFEKIDSLINTIKEDKNSKNITQKRFSVRYIFLSTIDSLKKFTKEIKKLPINVYDLSDLLLQKDGWITKQEMLDKIKTLNSHEDFLLLPFSEIARFYNKSDFNNLFSQLTELENVGNSNQRFYIPLLGLSDRFKKEFLNNFNRRFEYSFTWGIKESIQRTTILLSKNISLKLNQTKNIVGTKEWLTYWKKELSVNSICLSKTLYFLSDNAKPDEIFDFKKVENYKDLIYRITRIDIPIEYKESDVSFWEIIFEYVEGNQVSSFNQIVHYFLQVTQINNSNFINMWFFQAKTKFEKWLIKCYILINKQDFDGYLYITISKLNSFDDIDLFAGILFNVYEIEDPSQDVFESRIKLIKQMIEVMKFVIPQTIIDCYREKLEFVKDIKSIKKYLSGSLDCEKELIIKHYNGNKEGYVFDKYSDLQAYLDECHFDNLKKDQEWINDYFNEYKISKIKNQYTDRLSALISDINKDENTFYKWYYSFEEVSKYLHDKYDYIFWLDAVGIEWMGLIEKWIIHNKYNIDKIDIARVNIPSTTENNYYKEATHFCDFDKYIHDNYYQFPKSIVEEINKIIEILDNLKIQRDKKAIIISDHGLSAFVRLNDSSKNFLEAKHEGRYLKKENNNSYIGDENYVISGDYIIASKHISLSGKPKREVHGGCTPEEVLVPVVVFNSYIEEDKYEIELLTKKIKHKNPIVTFNISPDPKRKVICISNGRNIDLVKKTDGKYYAQLVLTDKKKYRIRLQISNFVKDYEIEVETGFKPNDMGI